MDKARTKQEQKITRWIFFVFICPTFFILQIALMCKILQICSTLQETQLFSGIFSTVVSAPSLQMSPSGSVEAKTDRPQMFRLAL